VPIYEYLCERCGRLTEVMQKVTDRPPATCPECGSKRLVKLVSRTAFQLKGGGWHADLYGSPKKKETGKEPAPEAASGKAAPEASSGKAATEAASGKAAPEASSGKPEANPGTKAEKAPGKKPAAKRG